MEKYNYEFHKKELYSDLGMQMLLDVNDKAIKLIEVSGCVKVSKVLDGITGDSFTMLACIDQLIKMKRVREVFPVSGSTAQNRILIKCQ